MNIKLNIRRDIDEPHPITKEPYSVTYRVESETEGFSLGSNRGLEVSMTEKQFETLVGRARLAMED